MRHVPRAKFPVPGMATDEMPPASNRGEHNREILAEFGHGEDDVLLLSERGIIVCTRASTCDVSFTW